MNSIIKKPSAWIPIALSLMMLATMVILFTTHGVPTPDQNKDEGVGAHLFQIWLVLEAITISFFAIKWLPEKPRPALLVLIIQVLLIIVGMAPIFLLKL